MTNKINFDILNLKMTLLKGIYTFGFEYPSKVQLETIPCIMNKEEIVVKSRSGTGKTGAFSIGALQTIDETDESCQVLVLVTSHELADQVRYVFLELSKYMNIGVETCIGQKKNDFNILNKSQIVVGTPGKCLHSLRSHLFKANKLKLLILDEADSLLRGDFQQQIEGIVNMLPKNIQICLYSATYYSDNTYLDKTQLKETFSEETKEIVSCLIDDPKYMNCDEEFSVNSITQFYSICPKEENKYELLKLIYSKAPVYQSIVYVNRIETAEMICEMLTKDNYSVNMIHGSMKSETRVDVMKNFRNAKFRILVATDVLSRGIDIQHLQLVVNYNVPKTLQTYIHRIGRSGRYNKKGIAISIVSYFERKKTIDEFGCSLGHKIEETPEDLTPYLQ